MPEGISECHEAIGQEALRCAGSPGWRALRIECLLDARSTDILFARDEGPGQEGYVTSVGRLPELFLRLSDLMERSGGARWTQCDVVIEPGGAYNFAFTY